MNIEVLVSSMNSDDSILNRMRIDSDAVIINQTDYNKIEYLNKNGKTIKFMSNDNRGVGRSRNLALMNSKADICLIADEDMIYVDNYEEVARKEFEKHPDADLIAFTVESLNPERPCYKETNDHKVNKLNFMKHGACGLAVKRASILKNNIMFSLMFGGGAKYGSGEDSLFLSECLDKGLVMYSVSAKIADVTQEDSTWFKGYTDKYYFDKGALFAAMGKYRSILLIPAMSVKMKGTYSGEKSISSVMKLMFNGRRDFFENKNIEK